MLSADLLREARLRAGLSQREVARRAGRPQSSIARWERGTMQPSLETLRELVRACGFDIGFRLAHADDSYARQIDDQLALTPLARLRQCAGDEKTYGRLRSHAA